MKNRITHKNNRLPHTRKTVASSAFCACIAAVRQRIKYVDFSELSLILAPQLFCLEIYASRKTTS